MSDQSRPEHLQMQPFEDPKSLEHDCRHKHFKSLIAMIESVRGLWGQVCVRDFGGTSRYGNSCRVSCCSASRSRS